MAPVKYVPADGFDRVEFASGDRLVVVEPAGIDVDPADPVLLAACDAHPQLERKRKAAS